jgi:hypothetical protein
MRLLNPHPLSQVIHVWGDSQEQVIFHCAQCGRPFFGKPKLIVSVQNYPFCLECAQMIVDMRKQHGMQVVEINPVGYEGGYVNEQK